jgi:hypothetical protein
MSVFFPYCFFFLVVFCFAFFFCFTFWIRFTLPFWRLGLPDCDFVFGALLSGSPRHRQPLLHWGGYSRMELRWEAASAPVVGPPSASSFRP